MEDLHNMSLFNTDGLMKVAEFEKVSFDQFKEDCENTIPFIKEDPKAMYENINLPVRKTKGSAGHDFVSPFDFTVRPGDSITIPTGVRCKISTGYVLMIYVRSSMGIKKGAKLSNGTGIIDSDYYNADNEGHIFAKIENHGAAPMKVKAGEGILQGVFIPFGVADKDEVTMKRIGGIGSTSETNTDDKEVK